MIKNIIFDLCGPIITLDLNMMDDKFKSFGVKNTDRPYRHLYELGITKEFEQNLISPSEFCDKVRSAFSCDISDENIFDAWNTLIADFPASHGKLLEALSGKYDLFLLSNSDVVNADFFRNYINGRMGYDFFGTVFTRTFFSCDLKLRKPSPEIFTTILQRCLLDPSETLFIDDCKKHTEGAASVGISTVFLEKPLDIADLFDNDLNPVRP